MANSDLSPYELAIFSAPLPALGLDSRLAIHTNGSAEHDRSRAAPARLLRRDCSDALEVLLRENTVSGLHPLGESIRTLSPTFRAHGEQIQAAAWARDNNTLTWHLIHVLEKLERGVE